MSELNWFPGHMKKALNQMAEEVKKVDMLIYVLDSRAPFSCINPSFSSLAINKPVLYILNKFDLADDKKTTKFKEFIEKNENYDGGDKSDNPMKKYKSHNIFKNNKNICRIKWNNRRNYKRRLFRKFKKCF